MKALSALGEVAQISRVSSVMPLCALPEPYKHRGLQNGLQRVWRARLGVSDVWRRE
jgi:hypothetical protein